MARRVACRGSLRVRDIAANHKRLSSMDRGQRQRRSPACVGVVLMSVWRRSLIDGSTLVTWVTSISYESSQLQVVVVQNKKLLCYRCAAQQALLTSNCLLCSIQTDGPFSNSWPAIGMKWTVGSWFTIVLLAAQSVDPSIYNTCRSTYLLVQATVSKLGLTLITKVAIILLY